MQFEEEIIINAWPDVVFAKYVNVAAWHLWDADVKSASLCGAFEVGHEGELEPANGPKAGFKLVEVGHDKSFISETKLPLCVMRFEHLLEKAGESTKVIHRVNFSGPLTFLWGRLIGSQIRKGLPSALSGLKTLCEAANHE